MEEEGVKDEEPEATWDIPFKDDFAHLKKQFSEG